jgi:hypothetical protein
MTREPSEGVFFIVRLPTGWQLCTCRQDEYGPMGLPDFWVETLGATLNLWLAYFQEQGPDELEARHRALEKNIGLLVAGYDAFPRGEIKRGVGKRRFIVRHGGDLTRAMHVPRREIEEAFGIRGKANWVVEPLHRAMPESAARVRELLPIAERWEGAG